MLLKRDPQVPHSHLFTRCWAAGGEQPIPLWNEHDTSTDADKPKILLYSLSLMFKVSHDHRNNQSLRVF